MTFADQVKESLNHIISEMAQSPWLFSKNPISDFSRNRKMDFGSLLHFCISMETDSVRDELLKYFSFDPDTLTSSAFLQQCFKLLPETIPFLFHQFNALYPFTLYKEKYICLHAMAPHLHLHAILMIQILIFPQCENN